MSLSAERFKNRIEKLRTMLAEQGAEIERLTNIIRATEVERDAGDDVANNLRAEIANLKQVIEDLSDHNCAAERMTLIKQQGAEIEQLQRDNAFMASNDYVHSLHVLITRAADALESGHDGRTGLPYEEKPGCQLCDLIAKLREAAK